MKSETLSLQGQLDETIALNIAQLIGRVSGVKKVNVLTAESVVKVDFDDELTSVQELRTVVQKAGLGAKAVHGENGMCCGSCGGQ
ncbi:hypothetical protein EGT07_11375 [Herbaspirillum sp. HC18]|nr:hypothetical protein EGT07_11375 [Herbaspirillum sp. HC18]